MPFPSTHWTLLAPDAPKGKPAGPHSGGDLCRRYQGTARAFIRSRSHPQHGAEDLTQDSRLPRIDPALFQRTNRPHGRLCCLLRHSLVPYLKNSDGRELSTPAPAELPERSTP